MSDTLKNLPAPQKKIVVGLACMIEAQGNGGRFRSNDPGMDIIIAECFDDSWNGLWDNEYRHRYLGEAALYAANNQDACIRALADMDDTVKYAFKNMMIDIIGDNAMMVLASAYIYKKIGMPKFTPPEQRVRVAKNEKEDDGTKVLEDSFYRLVDLGAIRGESDKVFRFKDTDTDEEQEVGSGYDYWQSKGICPVKGIVGVIDPEQSIQTDEGTLCYLVCFGGDYYLVVPIMEWGVEKIDSWEYQKRSQNVKIMICDRSGNLCRQLKDMNKTSRPTEERDVASTPSDQTVVRFTALYHQRFEGGVRVSAEPTYRDISLTYTKRGSQLELEIFGLMQPRVAKIAKDDGRVLTYNDISRPFAYYEVETEPVHNTIVRISIFQKNENFEDLEYRYTIDEVNA